MSTIPIHVTVEDVVTDSTSKLRKGCATNLESVCSYTPLFLCWWIVSDRLFKTRNHRRHPRRIGRNQDFHHRSINILIIRCLLTKHSSVMNETLSFAKGGVLVARGVPPSKESCIVLFAASVCLFII